MILQYDVSSYAGAVALLLITGIAAILFAVFMFLDFFKNKKIHHLLWGLAFFILFLAGVILVATNDYSLLLSAQVASLAALIPGGIAAGLYFVVFEDKTKFYGYIYLVFIIVMAVLIAIVKIVGSPGASATVMVAHIPSGLSIILLPIYTTVKTKDTDWKAYLLTIGGIVISIAGILLALFSLGAADIVLILTLLPIVLLITALFFALGTILPEKWGYAIPGIKS
ncbi:MAG: hypothetical protein ACFFE4_09150 [Candidatus Thorarchaeota archaeon]